jgi:hypothetical protein
MDIKARRYKLAIGLSMSLLGRQMGIHGDVEVSQDDQSISIECRFDSQGNVQWNKF